MIPVLFKRKPWLVAIHETFHLLRLPDRYNQTTGEAYDGFKDDIMGNLRSKNLSTSQTHWNNRGNYLTKPEFQQQKTQNPTQFILKYRVDVSGHNSNKKLIN